MFIPIKSKNILDMYIKILTIACSCISYKRNNN